MNIPLKTWMKYKDKLAAIDRRAEVEMISFVQSIGGYGDHVNECLDYAFALATKYGEAAGAAACELYEAVAAASGITLEAMPAATATYEEVAKSLNGIHKISTDPAKLSQGVSRLVKRTAADTTLQNAVRDGAYFAWVPSGDTCAFCLMLASNGWRKAGKKTLKGDHAEHIHANCDCQYAVTFDPLSGVEGYDPAEYEAMFDGIDGDWNKKVNAVRRQQYAKNKDRINAKKRASYNKRKAVDVYSKSNYNTPPIDDDEIRRRYERDVKDGWISPNCGLDNYKSLYYEIDRKVIGLETPNGTVITGQSEHFLTRVIGTSLDPSKVENGVYKITTMGAEEKARFKSNARNGVRVEDVIDTIKHGRVEKVKYTTGGQPSIKIVGQRCKVTFNPETGLLIQCNP